MSRPMRPLFAAAALAALAACSPKPSAEKPAAAPEAAAARAAAPIPADLPAGLYGVDLAHTSVNFRVDHIGMSKWTARFTEIDGTLDIDPKNPSAAKLNITIDPASIQTNYPGKDVDFDKEVAGPAWLDAPRFPQITFVSTRIDQTGPTTADITGDLTLHGVTRPVVLKTTFNGGYKSHPMDPKARLGFSATGSLERSDFGVSAGIPAPGTTMGVGDEVEIIIEAEFSQK